MKFSTRCKFQTNSNNLHHFRIYFLQFTSSCELVSSSFLFYELCKWYWFYKYCSLYNKYCYFFWQDVQALDTFWCLEQVCHLIYARGVDVMSVLGRQIPKQITDVSYVAAFLAKGTWITYWAAAFRVLRQNLNYSHAVSLAKQIMVKTILIRSIYSKNLVRWGQKRP